jgi:hypothetical protein
MRKPKIAQPSLHTPLNDVLGTEANVRLLRVLALAGSPMGAGELAKRAHLARTSIYPALETLERTGIVEFVGAGAQRQIQFRLKHPLGRPIRVLFAAEAERISGLIAALRAIGDKLPARPISIWMEHADATGGDHDSLTLWVLAQPAHLTSLTDHLSELIGAVEMRYGVDLDVRPVTRSELERRAKTSPGQLEEAMLVLGVPPAALAGRTAGRTARPHMHEEHDERARRLAAAIAARLKRNPSLIRRAREQLQERAEHASPAENRELKEWMRILTTMSPARLQRFLVERTERATRLRQSLPMLDLLTPAERAAVLKGDMDDEGGAALPSR